MLLERAGNEAKTALLRAEVEALKGPAIAAMSEGLRDQPSRAYARPTGQIEKAPDAHRSLSNWEHWKAGSDSKTRLSEDYLPGPNAS